MTRHLSAIAFTLSMVAAACGGGDEPESTNVDSTTVCGDPVSQVRAGQYRFECTTEASDSRVAGSEVQLIEFESGTTGPFTGTFEVTNDGGSWSGPITGSIEGGEAVTQGELSGSGDYEGLVYTFESSFTDDADGGSATRTGTIATAP